MKAYYAIAITLVLIAALTYNHATQYVPEKVHPVVKLTMEEMQGHASAVHIGNGFFITVKHALSDDSDGVLLKSTKWETPVSADVLWTSEIYDIAYLDAEGELEIDHYDISCKPLIVGQELEFHGNPGSLEDIITYGRVSNSNEISDFIWKSVVVVNTTILPGMSGGAVLNANKELVGIIVGTNMRQTSPYSSSHTEISFIVPSTIICKLLNKI